MCPTSFEGLTVWMWLNKVTCKSQKTTATTKDSSCVFSFLPFDGDLLLPFPMLLPNLIDHDFFALSLHSVSAVQTTWRPGLQRKKLCKPARDKSTLASASCKPNQKHKMPPKIDRHLLQVVNSQEPSCYFFTNAKPSIWKGTERFKRARTESSSIL